MSDAKRWARVSEVLSRALDLPRDEAARYVREEVRRQPEMRTEVLALLQELDVSDDFLESPAVERPPSGDSSLSDEQRTRTMTKTQALDVGQRIGPYVLRREIGKGGMGVVYEAEQERPVRRQVALKLIKWGMDTKAVIARFESERQALALMNHPNIARVYDAGASESGRPYFAMEYIPGIRITEYCDTRKLTLDERLRLFLEICDGVQHAHQKGIIHRDIKPSNVLVMELDGHPVAKIIDFGVAKATSQRLTEHSVATELGELIGTPEYMSPEQAEMTNLDIDTRTDVYSLGVLLYELLVGAQPLDPTELRSSGLVALRRRLRESEPVKPSTRISELGEDSESSAKNRRIETAALVRQLRGDLDWITMKAIEKDRTRRYETPSALAADISRYLKSEPVSARAPSGRYLAQKFVRRHRVAVATVGAVVASLLVAVFMTTASSIRARRAEADAKNEAARATAVTEFLQETLSSADPAEEGRDVKVVDVLGRASDEAGSKFGEQPETEAAIRSTLGATFLALGQYPEAVQELEKSVRINRLALGDGDETTLEAVNALVAAYYYAGELDRAEELSRDASRVANERYGPEHDASIETSVNLATILNVRGRDEEASEVEERTLRAARARYGDDHETTMVVANNLAHSLKQLGRVEESLELYRELLQTRTKASGAKHPQTLNVKHNLAMLLATHGEADEAERLHRELVRDHLEVYGPEHPKTIVSRIGLALALLAGGKLEEAAATFEAVIPAAVAAHSSGSPSPYKYMRHYGVCLKRMERYEESEVQLLRALRGLEATLGRDNFETERAIDELADLYDRWRKPEMAESIRSRP